MSCAFRDRWKLNVVRLFDDSDVNDNAPVFQQPAYLANVAEDALVGTSVLQVCYFLIVSSFLPSLFVAPVDYGFVDVM